MSKTEYGNPYNKTPIVDALCSAVNDAHKIAGQETGLNGDEKAGRVHPSVENHYLVFAATTALQMQCAREGYFGYNWFEGDEHHLMSALMLLNERGLIADSFVTLTPKQPKQNEYE